jgi:hypothetical protein
MHFILRSQCHQPMENTNPPLPIVNKGKLLGELGGCLLTDSKGISVFFLVIAMLLMVIIGYVFSYLMPTKHKSVIFPIQSNQAFFISQSGAEFAVRYAQDQGWTTTTLLNNLNGITRNLGRGRFTLIYNYGTYGDRLISIGEVPSANERRRISVSNFTQFLVTNALIIDPNSPAPCLTSTRFLFWYQYEASFNIKNVGSSSITLDSFRATWDVDPPQINRVRLNGATNVYTGSYTNGGPRTYFIATYAITAGNTIQVQIRWTWNFGTCDFNNLIIYFYDINGNMYTFGLDPEGDGVPGC